MRTNNLVESKRTGYLVLPHAIRKYGFLFGSTFLMRKEIAMRFKSNETIRFTWNNQNYEADVVISYHEDSDTPPNIEGWEIKQLFNITRKRVVSIIYVSEDSTYLNYDLKKSLEDAINEHVPTNAPYDGSIKEPA